MSVLDRAKDTTRVDDPINTNLASLTREEGSKTWDFLTLQSLTMSAAALAVTGALAALRTIFPGVSQFNQPWMPLVIAGVIIFAGFLNNWDDLKTLSKRAAALLIGAINALLLTAAALGIQPPPK